MWRVATLAGLLLSSVFGDVTFTDLAQYDRLLTLSSPTTSELYLFHSTPYYWTGIVHNQGQLEISASHQKTCLLRLNRFMDGCSYKFDLVDFQRNSRQPTAEAVVKLRGERTTFLVLMPTKDQVPSCEEWMGSVNLHRGMSVSRYDQWCHTPRAADFAVVQFTVSNTLAESNDASTYGSEASVQSISPRKTTVIRRTLTPSPRKSTTRSIKPSPRLPLSELITSDISGSRTASPRGGSQSGIYVSPRFTRPPRAASGGSASSDPWDVMISQWSNSADSLTRQLDTLALESNEPNLPTKLTKKRA
ncbi:hypothetical protein PSACC_00956 [Paramicrosporidium saccamoebae]|uniref:Uncharacterized protein n=1 Tax=Paramicrosporidium saccamoebae TaxID=1246581 RepID=A0A2H9TN94_9FUNG|nr:hypothetical protein PSACC_00956 [Paramicrosporidium saccamoebae]